MKRHLFLIFLIFTLAACTTKKIPQAEASGCTEATTVATAMADALISGDGDAFIASCEGCSSGGFRFASSIAEGAQSFTVQEGSITGNLTSAQIMFDNGEKITVFFKNTDGCPLNNLS